MENIFYLATSIFYLATLFCMVTRGEESASTIDSIDEYLYIHSDVTVYTWWNTQNSSIAQQIAKLLHGEEIILTADIEEGLNVDALKFKNIEIDFLLDEQSKQESLDAAINDFGVVMKMIGENLYRCGVQVNTIPKTQDIDIVYSFAKGIDGLPAIQNEGYKMIRLKDLFLSPYTTWSIKLNTLGSNTTSFDTLVKFANEEIHLQLYGDAAYLRGSPIEVCNKYMEKWTTPQHEKVEASTLDVAVDMVEVSTANVANNSTVDMVETSTANVADDPTFDVANNSTVDMVETSTANVADDSTVNVADNSTVDMVEVSTANVANNSTVDMDETSTANVADDSTVNVADNSAVDMVEVSTVGVANNSTVDMIDMVETSTANVADNSTVDMVETATVDMVASTVD